jgi:hypothetical protein
MVLVDGCQANLARLEQACAASPEAEAKLVAEWLDRLAAMLTEQDRTGGAERQEAGTAGASQKTWLQRLFAR